MKWGVLQEATVTVSTIVSNVTSLVTESVKWVGSFAGAITSNPLILTFVIVAFVGLGVGLIKRLVRVRERISKVMMSVISLV